MEGFKHITKMREYLDYLEEHLTNVQKAWKEMQTKCGHMQFIHDDYVHPCIDRLVFMHDLSKFSEQEFTPYCKAFFPVENQKTKLPQDVWQHHIDHNPHHWENWTSKEYSQETAIHCVCMVLDWMAMGYKFGDTPKEYYEANKEKIILPVWGIKLIYEIFDALGE